MGLLQTVATKLQAYSELDAWSRPRFSHGVHLHPVLLVYDAHCQGFMFSESVKAQHRVKPLGSLTKWDSAMPGRNTLTSEVF